MSLCLTSYSYTNLKPIEKHTYWKDRIMALKMLLMENLLVIGEKAPISQNVLETSLLQDKPRLGGSVVSVFDS